MYCTKFRCTISTGICIKRQTIEPDYDEEREYGLSYDVCRECKQGKKVLEDPLTFINRDVERLKTKTSINQPQTLKYKILKAKRKDKKYD